MDYWANFYEKYFNFEEASQSTGQIEEFLMAYNGEAIQHIVLPTENICETVDLLKANGVPFMAAPPNLCYEMLENGCPDMASRSMR